MVPGFICQKQNIQSTMSRRRNTKKKKATRMVDAVDSDEEDSFGGAMRDSSLVKNAAKKTKGKSKSSSSSSSSSSNAGLAPRQQRQAFVM